MRATFVFVLLGLVGQAAADPIADLQKALPGGWRVLKHRGELVIQRDRPVRIAGKYYPNAEHTSNLPRVAPTGAPTILLALRYRYEDKWSAAKLATAKGFNERIGKQLEALRARYRIDEIRTAKGTPLPQTPDETRRLADFQAEHARAVAKLVEVPRCTLGEISVFTTRETYHQLDLMVDPPIAMREAYAVVELVKRRCR